MNHRYLLLFRRALPGRGVQRELPSTITNGQKLVLSARLPQNIFFLCGFWAETASSRKRSRPLPKNITWDEKSYGSRERRPEYNRCFHRAWRLWRARNPSARTAHIYKDLTR